MIFAFCYNWQSVTWHLDQISVKFLCSKFCHPNKTWLPLVSSYHIALNVVILYSKCLFVFTAQLWNHILLHSCSEFSSFMRRGNRHLREEIIEAICRTAAICITEAVLVVNLLIKTSTQSIIGLDVPCSAGFEPPVFCSRASRSHMALTPLTASSAWLALLFLSFFSSGETWRSSGSSWSPLRFLSTHLQAISVRSSGLAFAHAQSTSPARWGRLKRHVLPCGRLAQQGT